MPIKDTTQRGGAVMPVRRRTGSLVAGSRRRRPDGHLRRSCVRAGGGVSAAGPHAADKVCYVAYVSMELCTPHEC